MEHINRNGNLVVHIDQINSDSFQNAFLDLDQAHALRAPLTNILGLIELLKLQDLEVSEEELIDRLSISAVDLDNTTRCLITIGCGSC